eukprot:CAMPEP_0182870914 /NCGR_PEP_ID=MMETSP0034_2-20130328/10810_1 /TAXON_ID=156128 /ORGANISM="Nephroselmis pyriformis, Strain CCMP717" /LENGTH=665 /DNA_ID=CAMNT_0025003431 /DNA_START=74 /DNA_END=2067 /DNA_ORIENTATION=+
MERPSVFDPSIDGSDLGSPNGSPPKYTDIIHPSPYRAPATPPVSGLLKAQLKLKPKVSGKGVEVEQLEHELDFDKGFFMVIRAIQMITHKNDQPVNVVGLAGPSGAGKSHLAKRLLEFIPGCETICMDDFLDTTQLKDGNFDDPKLTDFELLQRTIQTIKEGKEAQVPIYSFKESRRVGFRTCKVPTSRVLIVEGIYALHGSMRNQLDLTVSIHGGVHFDLIKRIQRDLSRSEQNPQEVVQQITDTVYPMYKAFIEPDLLKAAIRIRNGFNPFSGFLKRVTYTLKSDKPYTAQEVERRLSEWSDCSIDAKDEETTDIYFLPPNEDQETCKDWIRMRLRNGRYWMSFEEYLTDGPMMISPRMSFDVSVRVLSGLMSLGYTIGAIVKRVSTVYHVEHHMSWSSEKDAAEAEAALSGSPAAAAAASPPPMQTVKLVVKLDVIEQLDKTFISVSSSSREVVQEVGDLLELADTYVPRSYIEEVQLKRLTQEFAPDIEDLRRAIETKGPQGVFTPPTSPPPRSHAVASGSPGGTGIAMLQAHQRRREIEMNATAEGREQAHRDKMNSVRDMIPEFTDGASESELESDIHHDHHDAHHHDHLDFSDLEDHETPVKKISPIKSTSFMGAVSNGGGGGGGGGGGYSGPPIPRSGSGAFKGFKNNSVNALASYA